MALKGAKFLGRTRERHEQSNREPKSKKKPDLGIRHGGKKQSFEGGERGGEWEGMLGSGDGPLSVSPFTPTPAMPIDLKQVAKLFNDTLAEVWDNTPDLETLEPQAIEWLKAARHKLMRDLE
ncbi:hypothetical protein B0H13DRAFT_1903718 [Mycena leptocephala]|nr:hypothetical protein B0H13DRAFT_1903718 [Mycena leptocephala]